MEKSTRQFLVLVVFTACAFVAQANECPTLEERVTVLEHDNFDRTGWTKASNGMFYKYFKDQPVDYNTAKSICKSLGARLVSTAMQTAALRDEVKALVTTTPWPSTWIGLDDYVTQGTYVWSDGTLSTRANTDWANTIEPNETFQRCAAMHSWYRGGVADIECDTPFHYICESCS